MILIICKGKNMKELIKKNKISCRKIMKWYLILHVCPFIFLSTGSCPMESLIVESPGRWLQSIFCIPLLSTIKSWIYVVLPSELFSLLKFVPDNGGNYVITPRVTPRLQMRVRLVIEKCKWIKMVWIGGSTREEYPHNRDPFCNID